MRSTYYPGVCTESGTYYQGWFMYMRYTQGQNEEHLLSRSMYQTRHLVSKLHCMCILYVALVTALTVLVCTFDISLSIGDIQSMDTYVHTYVQYAHRSNPRLHGYIRTYIHTVRTS